MTGAPAADRIRAPEHGAGSVLLLLADRRLADRLRQAFARTGISALCGDPAQPAAAQVTAGRAVLLLIDAQLPNGRTGAETAVNLRVTAPQLPVIIYGPVGNGSLRMALQAGVRDAIPAQPDPAGEILAVIQRELQRSPPSGREAPAFWSSAAEALESGLLACDASGRISEVNAQAATLLGWKPEGLLGSKLEMHYTPPPAMHIRAAKTEGDALRPPHAVSVEGAMLRKADGTALLIEGTLAPALQAQQSGGCALLFRPAAPGGAASRLNENEALIRQLLDQSPDPVLRTNAAGRIIYANNSAARLLGWEAAELQNRLFNELVAADNERAPGKIHLSQVMRAALGSPTELAMRHHDGSVRYVAWTFHPLPETAGQSGGGLAAGRDTTLRHVAERELIESEARYRRLLDAALEGIMVISAQSGVVLDANPALLELLSLNRDDCVGKALWEIPAFSLVFHGPDTLERLTDKRVVRGEELPLKTGGGDIRYVEFASQVYRDDGEALISCNLRDISSLKKEMAVSRRQAERLRLVNQIALMVNERLNLESALPLIVEEIQHHLQAGAVAVLRLNPDGANLKVLASGGGGAWDPAPIGLVPGMLLNAADNPLLGSAAGSKFERLALRADAANPLERALANLGCTSAGAIPLRVEGSGLGLLLYALAGGTAAADEAQQFLAQIANHVAVAVRNAELYQELQDACALLRATQQQVVAQERLSALGTMASGIAHDLNNALAPVIGFTELLLEDSALLAGQNQARHYLEMIRTGATDGAAVVARLREFYRHRQTGEVLVELDLNEVVRQTIELTTPRWKNIAMANGVKISVRSELCASAGISGSEAELRELLANLILNAADAMPEGGEIGLITETLADGRVSLEVRDTGTGMSAEVKARCLEPFFSTKGVQGTGLGLAMAYGIAQRHGAQLEIESLPGHGTSVTAVFPRFSPALMQAPAAGESPVTPLRILVADDDAAMRELLNAYLRADGHTVTLAMDGEEAFTLCRPGHFDLVISDRAMPRMNGLQLAKQLRRQPGAPVLLLLSGFRDASPADSLPAGVDALLAKPVTRRRLRQVIAQFAIIRTPAVSEPAAVPDSPVRVN